MQTLWSFGNFPVGYPPDYFQSYFEKLAVWKKLGNSGIRHCDPTKAVEPGQRYDLATQLSCTFGPSDPHFKPRRPGVSWQQPQVTNHLAESVGFQLEFVEGVRCLEIQPGSWTEPAPLPETDPEFFTFWYCTSNWSAKLGGSLKVTPKEGDSREFHYQPVRAVLVGPGLPHVLTPIKQEAKHPYYCLYGQLRETK